MLSNKPFDAIPWVCVYVDGIKKQFTFTKVSELSTSKWTQIHRTQDDYSKLHLAEFYQIHSEVQHEVHITPETRGF